MSDPGFFDQLGRDLSGRGIFGGSHQIRLVLQPLIATILGIRFGIRDAKTGRLPFFQRLARGTGERGHLLGRALRDAIIPLIVAFILDSVLQHMINHRIHPLQSVIVGGLLVFIPFVIVRALANRIWSQRHAHAH
jgi:hypothetical protein